MNFLIRNGKVGDLTSILELINELAEIKNETENLTVTIYDLIRDGFSINPLFQTFVVEIDRRIVGFSIFYMSYSTNGRSLIIEDTFVTKEYKKLGIGLSLFAKCLDFADKNGIQRIEWGLLKQYDSLMELYKRAGAKILYNTRIFEIYREDILKITATKFKFNKPLQFKKVVVRFGEINDMSSVLELMKGLVAYKNSSCDVDVYDLVKDGFSKRPLFKTIVLEVDDDVVGMLMFYVSYSTLHGKSLIIEDISLKKEYIGYGFGKALNIKLFEFAKLNGIQKIQQAIFDYDKAPIDKCLVFGAKKVKGMRLVQISYDALHNFINR